MFLDDDRDRFIDRGDRYGGAPERRGRDYSPSPPRGIDSRTGGSYRDYAPPSREYSPPPRDYTSRDRGITRDYGSSRDYTSSRDSFSRDSYSRDTSRDYTSSRSPLTSRDYISRDSGRGPSRDFDRLADRAPPRDSYDSYRDSGSYSRGSPPRSSAPLSRSYGASPLDRSRDMDRDRGRDYSPPPGSRRPAPYERAAPPPKRSRPGDSPPPRGPPRGSPPPRSGPPTRGPPLRDGPLRDSPRGPPRGPPREGARGAPPPFRR